MILFRYIFWLIFSFTAALIVAIFSYFHLSNGENILYLLSALSQSLAAIFTLVFVITIFGAQMTGKFTAIDRMVDKWTKAFMILFSIGIILPLIQLSTDVDLLNIGNASNFGLAFELGLATFCILTIIPYLIRVNLIMKYEGGISKVREELFEAIDSKHKAVALNKVRNLSELGISAVEDKLEWAIVQVILSLRDSYTTYHFEETLIALEEIGFRSKEKKLHGFVYQIYKILEDIGKYDEAKAFKEECGGEDYFVIFKN